MHIRSQKKTVWALAIAFSTLSFIFWLQIGLNAIGTSGHSQAALLKMYAIEERESAATLEHRAAREEAQEFAAPSDPIAETSEGGNLRSALNEWELRRAFGLSIPSLSLRAPVFLPSRKHWDTRNWELLEQQMQAGMILGTVAYPHSSRPGPRGALFVAGHSSPPSQEAVESAYGTVFRSLPNMHPGAEIVITDGDERFTYVVTDTFIVNADDTGILDPANAEGSLTLITCYPVGTTRQRYVVRAKLTE